MALNIRISTTARIMLVGCGLLTAGACATEQTVMRNPYGSVEYAGARRVYEPDRLAPKQLPYETVKKGNERVALLPERFEGIAGARRVHKMYPQDVAERLDGNCESAIRVAANEKIADVADYCDIPVKALVRHNEYLGVSYDVEEGAFLRIPGAADLSSGASGIANAVSFSQVTAVPGDTVENIAVRYNVSATDVKALNPQFFARDVLSGEPVRLPSNAAATPVATVSSTPSYQSDDTASSSWVGYAPEPEPEEEDRTDIVDAHMPYMMRPGRKPSR
ncbi:MAG: LysM peptidoglycan-binding domain-containing protein [Pseudomonadota bacterium]